MAIKNVNTINERRSKIVRNRVFDCHFSPDWRQMTIENTVSSVFDPRSSIVKSVLIAADRVCTLLWEIDMSSVLHAQL